MKKIFFIAIFLINKIFAIDFCQEPAYQNDFDEDIPDDSSFWLQATWGFEGSASAFDPDNVYVEDGVLKLQLSKTGMTGSDGEFYSFTGGEIRTMETFSYGRYEFEVDFSGLKGVNESFFLAWDGGNYAKHHQFMGFQFMEKGFVTLYSIGPDEDSNGNHQPALNTKTNQPKAINKGTHTFAIEYTNSYVTWFYDDEPFRKERSNLPTEKMNIIFRTWLPSSEQYTVKTTKLPLETKYNYIRYYPTIEVGCYTVSDKPQEEEPQPVVEEPIISDNQETISQESTNCQDNSISELTNKIDSLPLGSVNLLGTTKAIKDMTPFKNSIVVWVYVNGVWKAYSSDSTVTSALESNGVELIYYIPAFSGYWIQK